jgi:hypothetical protein
MATSYVDVRVFIVYQSNEEKLVEAIKQLVEHWYPGSDVFYCRQEDRETRPADGYRKLLRDKLSNASAVILLLSRGFQWSQYCQSEAGAVVVLESEKLRQLAVVIPPAIVNAIPEICPVLDGRNVLLAKAPSSGVGPDSFVPQLKFHLRQLLEKHAADFHAGENELVSIVNNELQSVIDHYLSVPSRREISEIWESIDGNSRDACHSIKVNIKKSLERKHSSLSAVALVGVSLKFSLLLLDEAISELVMEHKSPELAGRVGSKITEGKVFEILLVHMDDHSHILDALKDAQDIASIQNLHRTGEVWFQKWRDDCKDIGINLKKPRLVGIDYIPPRIGILIDDNVLYAGRCAFEASGVGFRLLVGEREYFHYTNCGERGKAMIREFRSFLEVYDEQILNGVELVGTSEDWLKRLESSILTRPDIHEVILVSQTASRFRPLIKTALKNGISLKIYVQKPDENKLPKAVNDTINRLEERIRQDIRNQTKARAEIYYFDVLPTFRAALIGDATIGVQMYVPADPDSGCNLTTSPLRIIATKYSSRFKLLREDLLNDFLGVGTINQKANIVHYKTITF